MSFILKFNDIDETREQAFENYTVGDLIVDLKLSAQTIVSKQNGEIVIEDTVIEDGDEIQLIQIIYGG